MDQQSSADQNTLDVTWGHALSVWWLFAWRAVVGAMLGGAIVGGVFGFVAGTMGVPLETISMIGGIIGAVIGIVWGIVVIKMALNKKYKNFRIVLVPVER